MAELIGAAHAAGRRPAPRHRPGPLRRRHPDPRHPPRGVRAEQRRARPHPIGRRERGTRTRRCAHGRGGPRARRSRGHAPAARAAGRFLAPAYPVLADDKVRCTGEPLAIVVAESRALAEDACELVDVDIEPLPAVVSIDDALDPSSALLFEELGTNVVYHRDRQLRRRRRRVRAARTWSCRRRSRRSAWRTCRWKGARSSPTSTRDTGALDDRHRAPEPARAAPVGRGAARSPTRPRHRAVR